MGKSKQKDQVVKTEPWAAAQPYMKGDVKKGIPGVLPEAANMYQAGKQYSPETVGAYGGLLGQLQSRAQGNQYNPVLDQLGTNIMSVVGGNLGPRLNQVGDIGGVSVDPTKMRQAQGVLDPTQSLQRFMTGEIDTRYLDPQAEAIVNRMTQNTMQNVMPGIRSGAVASGQYGGSRQGIAEGLAASQLQEDIAPALTGLYGQAFENAQQRAYGTSTGLNQQAQEIAQQNAANELAKQQFNAQLGMQRNVQELQRQGQDISTRQAGLGALQSLGEWNRGEADRAIAASQGLLDTSLMPQGYQQANFTNYANLINSLSGLGGQQVTPLSKNAGAGILGGAVGGSGLAKTIGGAFGGPLGTAIGAIGGGLLGGFM